MQENHYASATWDLKERESERWYCEKDAGVHIGDNSRVLKVSQFDTFTSTLELQKHPQITLKTLFKSTPYNFLSNTKRSTTDRLLESQA